jgi:biotin carboxylase
LKKKPKLLFLGGADIQVPAIEKAKGLGFHVVTCDYLPGNPGHRVSDEYHNVSTTDIPAVVSLAERLGVDAVTAYASDPAALTAAHVVDHLGIPGNSVDSVRPFCDKVAFRELQRKCGVPAPAFIEVGSTGELGNFVERFPEAILKPVDSSGSKGISRLRPGDDLEAALERARGVTRSGKVIVEEEFAPPSRICSGDVFVVDGEIAFSCFGDVHFGGPERLVPVSITIPHTAEEEALGATLGHLGEMFRACDVREGAFNLDVLFRGGGGPGVIIDIGARNGGNHLNDIIHAYSGFDLIEATMLQSVGEKVLVPETLRNDGFHAHYVVHSDRNGRFSGLKIPEFARSWVRFESMNVGLGGEVRRFRSSADRLGLLLLEFPSKSGQDQFKEALPAFAKVEVDE